MCSSIEKGDVSDLPYFSASECGWRETELRRGTYGVKWMEKLGFSLIHRFALHLWYFCEVNNLK